MGRSGWKDVQELAGGDDAQGAEARVVCENEQVGVAGDKEVSLPGKCGSEDRCVVLISNLNRKLES